MNQNPCSCGHKLQKTFDLKNWKQRLLYQMLRQTSSGVQIVIFSNNIQINYSKIIQRDSWNFLRFSLTVENHQQWEIQTLHYLQVAEFVKSQGAKIHIYCMFQTRSSVTSPHLFSLFSKDLAVYSCYFFANDTHLPHALLKQHYRALFIILQ